MNLSLGIRRQRGEKGRLTQVWVWAPHRVTPFKSFFMIVVVPDFSVKYSAFTVLGFKKISVNMIFRYYLR